MHRSTNATGRRRQAGCCTALALACCALWAGSPAAASAQGAPAATETSPAREAGLGVGAALGTLLYAPAKLVYAAGGLVVGGLGWAFSGGDAEVARGILRPSVGGDWVITPAHLTRQRRIEFVGAPPEDRWRSSGVATAPRASPSRATGRRDEPPARGADVEDPWSASGSRTREPARSGVRVYESPRPSSDR